MFDNSLVAVTEQKLISNSLNVLLFRQGVTNK